MILSYDANLRRMEFSETTGVMGDLMQQGGGGSRKSVSAEELGDIGSSNAALGHNRTFAVQKLSASTSEPSTLTCLVLS
jgi:hypothetical protein